MTTQYSLQDDSMNREDLIDRLAVIKMKRYKAFQNNWNTSKFDSEITEITDLLKQLTETIPPSDNLNTLEISTSENLNTLESNTTEILETLEFPQDEILETLEFPQGSAQDLDKFEVTYQVLDCDDVSYDSRKVYAYNHEHAKAIVSQDLQAQHLRHIITGCDYALVIDDLSDFSLVDEF